MEKEVLNFIAQHEGVDAQKISQQTLLFDDLDIDGDDAVDLISEFSEKFSVDLSGFDYKRYFGEEGLPIWFLIYWGILLIKRIFGKSPHEAAGLEPFPISKLVTAAEVGKLV